MDFKQAMECLEKGAKVTRQKWAEGIYFALTDDGPKCFQPKLEHYAYDESIMLSNGWLVEGEKKEYKFPEIIPFLQKGFKAKLKEWDGHYIYYDHSSQTLVSRSMLAMPFMPDFDSFGAQDWIKLD